MGHVNLNGESNGEASTEEADQEEADQEEEIRPEEASRSEEEATNSEEVGPQTGSQTVCRGLDALLACGGTGAKYRRNDSAADARTHDRVIVDWGVDFDGQ